LSTLEVLAWIRQAAPAPRSRLTAVCYLACWPLWRGGACSKERATTPLGVPFHHLLPDFGAIPPYPKPSRVVVRRNWVFRRGRPRPASLAALRLAVRLRVTTPARTITPHGLTRPEPPFDSGHPETAPAAILAHRLQAVSWHDRATQATALLRFAGRLGN